MPFGVRETHENSFDVSRWIEASNKQLLSLYQDFALAPGAILLKVIDDSELWVLAHSPFRTGNPSTSLYLQTAT
jgi:hypothetical protein